MHDAFHSLLESESIEIIREVAATAAKPVMLYSIGKDSAVLLHLAQKALYPGRIPFLLMHIATVNVSFDRSVPFAPHKENKRLGSIIVIDKRTSETVGAAIILFALRHAVNVHWQALEVTKAVRAELKNFTGIDSDCEYPQSPEVHLRTIMSEPKSCVDELAHLLRSEPSPAGLRERALTAVRLA